MIYFEENLLKWVKLVENKYYRQTWAEVDLAAISHNIKSYQSQLRDSQKIMAVVKANAYGHGAVPVALEALRSGATWLGVALLEEALELRSAGIEAPILVLGYFPEKYFSIAQEHGISVTIPDLESFQKMWSVVSNTLPPLRFHLKVDTGMGRLGIGQITDFEECIRLYFGQKNGKAQWEGVFTHFAKADDKQTDSLQEQVKKFKTFIEKLDQSNIKVPYVHMSNSAGILRTKDVQEANLIRLGISMYGLYPSPFIKKELPFDLKQAISLHTTLAQVKKIESGTGISYGHTYHSKEDEWIGTLPIGYADGWDRHLSNCSYVLVDGKRMPVVGRICMDQMMVRLDKFYPKGTKVTLIGTQGNQEITVDEIANILQTINYEIPCKLAKRVPRLYDSKS